jgi:single-stranded-DNA-specific exonuclease
MLGTEWLKKEFNKFSSRTSSEASASVSYPPLLEDFFSARGFSNSEDVDQFLHFSLKDLKDPLSLRGMDLAVERLMNAYKSQENICVYADFDMDGTPGLALMVRGLRLLGFKNIFYTQPHRHNDGYGFHAHLVEKFVVEKNVQLFITIDVGITDHAAVAKAKELGADVILTDHHQVNGSAPEALAVINPNHPECQSGMGYLCGTGVGFYLIMALRREMKNQNLLKEEFDIKQLLDCFAVATVADMVPLVKENRILVKHGLKVLEKTTMIGLRQLLISLKLSDKQLSAQDVGMRFVPKLNSLSRLETPLKAIDLFLVDDAGEALDMVSSVLKNNERRVQMLGEAEDLLETLVVQNNKLEFNAMFFWSEHFHRGLVGLLATELVQKYQKPAFVGALIGEGTSDATIVGSARAPEGLNLNVFEALKANEGLLRKYGGHPVAAGFELDPANAPALAQALDDYFAAQKPEKSNVVIAYDQDVRMADIKQFMNHWDELEPFGMQFSPPIFRLSDLRLESKKVLKGGHLRLMFRDRTLHPVEVMWFFPPNPEILEGWEQKIYSILCEPQWNEFMGSKRIQLLLKDIKA